MAIVPRKIAKGWKKQHKDTGSCERNICILFAGLTKSVQYSWAKSVLRQFARAGIWYNPLDSPVTGNLWDKKLKKEEIWGILYNLQHPTYYTTFFNTTHKISVGPGKGLLATFNVFGKEGLTETRQVMSKQIISLTSHILAISVAKHPGREIISGTIKSEVS